jgi:hypothetical protein
MSNIPPSRSSSPAAQHMGRYRKHRRLGLRSVRILLDDTDIDALIRMGLLKGHQRHELARSASPPPRSRRSSWYSQRQ